MQHIDGHETPDSQQNAPLTLPKAEGYEGMSWDRGRIYAHLDPIEHDYQLHIRPDANRVVLNEVYALLGRVGLELVDPWEMETMMDDGTVVFYLTPEWDVWAEGEELHGTGETA